MIETQEITNPENYKILIQIKKNRRLKRRKTKYLNEDLDFVENINQAKIFPDMQTAEQILHRVARFYTRESRPRIIVKYIIPFNQKNNEVT